MAKFGGVALKSLSLFLRFIEFCCATIVLGIFSYFLATLSDNNLHIPTYLRAVEGISGVAIFYTLIALVLVCFLGGITVFALLGVLLDVAFCAAFCYVAYANRGGAGSCKGHVNTPLGSGTVGDGNTVKGKNGAFITLPSLEDSCKLETAVFAVSIVALFFFLISAAVEFALAKHHKKEKAYGPSPANGYTSGSGKRKFWQRKPKNVQKNPDSLPAHSTPADATTSYQTGGDGTHTHPVGTAVPQNEYKAEY